MHHHRINMDKYHPGYFGKVGMRYFHKTKQQFYNNTINLDKLHTLLGEGAMDVDGKVAVVDTVGKVCCERERAREREDGTDVGAVATTSSGSSSALDLATSRFFPRTRLANPIPSSLSLSLSSSHP